MNLRAKILVVSIVAAVSIAVVTLVFVMTFQRLETIEAERARLGELSASVQNLSIVVNGLVGNRLGLAKPNLAAARQAVEDDFAAVADLRELPRINETLRSAFELIANMHGLITEDLAAMSALFDSLEKDATRIFVKADPFPLMKFYTDSYVREKFDLTDILQNLDNLNGGILSMTDTLATVSAAINDQALIIDQETARVKVASTWAAVAISITLALVSVLLTFLIGRSITRRVQLIQQSLVPVSGGDFSRDIQVEGHDEIARIAISLNNLLDSLKRMIGLTKDKVDILRQKGVELASNMTESTAAIIEIKAHIESSQRQLEAQSEVMRLTAEAATGLMATISSLGGHIGDQARILEDSSSSVGQMITSIASVAGTTENAEGATIDLLRLSNQGKAKIDLVARSVNDISKSSDNLVNASVVINDIAEKTKLLAMNASIEAAHAGDAGRGFGVVAGEIRQLAAQSAVQAQQISGDLKQVRDAILTIQQVSTEAFAAFGDILKQAGAVGDMVRGVRQTMREQNEGGTRVMAGIGRLKDITGLVQSGANDLETGYGLIKRKLGELADINTLVNRNNFEITTGTRDINTSVMVINGMTESNTELIAELEREIGRFLIAPGVRSVESIAALPIRGSGAMLSERT